MMAIREVIVVLFSFFAMLIDSSLGMGFGTTLSPLLLLLGFDPILLIPSLLTAQVLNGFGAALSHHALGNVDFRQRSSDLLSAFLLGLTGVVGVFVSVFFAIRLPRQALKMLIGGLVLLTGLTVYRQRIKKNDFSWARILSLGVVAAFNKGISGGAYGPLVTSGQLLSGTESKSAVAITALSETLVSIFAVLIYFYSAGATPDPGLVALMVIGSLPAAPLSAFIVSHSQREELSHAIGGLTSVLGLLTILNALR